MMVEDKQKYWRKLIAEQASSGQEARPFCRERGIGEYSFSKWWRRLRQHGPVQDRQAGGCGDIADGAGGSARMIHLPASVRVYVWLSPCDMRRSFDALHALMREHSQLDAFAGHLYLFANRKKAVSRSCPGAGADSQSGQNV
jgi:hypothetical protein